MTQIVQIDRARALRTLSAPQTGNESFDVLVFLNHFLTNDGYEETVTADPQGCNSDPDEPTAVQHLVMQSGNLRLSVSLGAGNA